MSGDPVSKIAQRFAGEHFALNSISERRQGQVLTALARLEAFLHPATLQQATDVELRDWMVKLLDDGLAPSTVGWYLRMVLPFYQWCWQQRLIGAEELMRIRSVKAPRGGSRAPRPYTRKELTRFWAELDAKFPYLPTPSDHRRANNYKLARWRNGTSPYSSVKKHAMRLQLDAIIELALACGLRRTEIYRLSIDDAHWDNKYIVVHGKRVNQNPKVREVPYPDSTRDAIYRWYRFRCEMGATTELLWLSVTGPDPTAPLSPDRMNMILHSFGDWQLHRLRHTCATERLRAGMAVEKLQPFLGHANIAQTLCYAELVRGDIHKASARIDADFQRRIRPAA